MDENDVWMVEGEPIPEDEPVNPYVYKDIIDDLLSSMTDQWNASGVRTYLEQKLREKGLM